MNGKWREQWSMYLFAIRIRSNLILWHAHTTWIYCTVQCLWLSVHVCTCVYKAEYPDEQKVSEILGIQYLKKHIEKSLERHKSFLMLICLSVSTCVIHHFYIVAFAHSQKTSIYFKFLFRCLYAVLFKLEKV